MVDHGCSGPSCLVEKEGKIMGFVNITALELLIHVENHGEKWTI